MSTLFEADGQYYDVAFATNRVQDLKWLSVAGRSLLENCSEPHRVRIHVLYAHLDEEQLQPLLGSWKGHACAVHFYCLEESLPNLAKDPRYGYWYRVWLGEILPPELGRVLYLDCDVVVRGDIVELWSISLEDKVAGVVWDPGYRVFRLSQALDERARVCNLSFPLEGPYFNSGVLLVNLDKWRDLQISKMVERHFGDNHWRSVHYDQDELNILLAGKVFPLSPTWNLLEPLILYQQWDFEIYQELAQPADYFSPKIRHFSGESKPDSPFVRWSDKEDFCRYLRLTSWRDWEKSIQKRRWLALVLELHYILIRGFEQRVFPDLWARLWDFLKRFPFVPFLYPVVPLYRIFLRVKRSFHLWISGRSMKLDKARVRAKASAGDVEIST